MFKKFSDITRATATISAADPDLFQSIAQIWNTRTKPPGSLGKLEEIATWIASVQQTRGAPTLSFPSLRLFAGSHGITEMGVSMCPAHVNEQMVANFHNGGAAINALCRSNQIDFKSYDVDVHCPTKNFYYQAAMTEEETVEAFHLGWQSVPAFSDLFAVGEMGIGNTTPSTAVIATITRTPVETIVGRGAGLTDERLQQKTEILATALRNRKKELTDPLSILASVGGREIAAMVGAILSAADKNIPIVLDGVISAASASIAFELQPNVISKCIAGHLSVEPAHNAFLKHYQLTPILDLGMRLGEGTGAAVAMGVIRNAVDTFNQMATFEQAGVQL